MKNNPKWLAELEDTIPKTAYGHAINVYSIAYEAWRRGLTVSFENTYSKSKERISTHYNIYNRKKNVKFHHNRSNLVSQEAINKYSNKILTREMISKENFPTPKSKVITLKDFIDIEKETEDFDYPVKITVLNSSKYKGKTIKAGSREELLKSLEYQKKQLESGEFLLEEFIEGKHYHAYIINDEVIGVYRTAVPSVTGDGIKTVKGLLADSNVVRSKIPSLSNLEVSVNKEAKVELKNQGFSPDTIPDKGQTVRLKATKDIFTNGDSIDATDEISDELKNNLIKASKVIPGLVQGEIEFIYDRTTGKYGILGINTKPDIRNYLFPICGLARPIPKAIIDYHFPETIGRHLSDTTPKYYFDYEVVNDHLRNDRLSKIILPGHRYEPNLISKSIKFESRHDIGKLRQIIRRNFIKLRFDGEFNLLDDNLYEIVLAGNYQDIAYFIDFLNTEKYLQSIKSNDYNGGVRAGYKFNDLRSGGSVATVNSKDSNKIESISTSKELVSYERTIKEKDDKISELEQEIKNIKSSKSWSITAPIRKMKNKFSK